VKIVAIGEAMLELSGDDLFSLGYGGDTLNTAVYIARLKERVSYFTALGVDDYSQNLLAEWQSEGVDTDLVCQNPDALPGIYLIQTSTEGERSFAYWRGESAARLHFASFNEEYFQKLYEFDFLLISGISLSLFERSSLPALWDFFTRFREKGGKVVFDINYRPENWSSVEQAITVVSKMTCFSDIALPSFEDEQQLFGDSSINDCVNRYLAAGVSEAVIKNGAKGCVLVEGNCKTHVPLKNIINPVDTTAAGDSFNAGYLVARMRGVSPLRSVEIGQQCATQVIQHRGAIIPRSEFNIVI